MFSRGLPGYQLRANSLSGKVGVVTINSGSVDAASSCSVDAASSWSVDAGSSSSDSVLDTEIQ